MATGLGISTGMMLGTLDGVTVICLVTSVRLSATELKI